MSNRWRTILQAYLIIGREVSHPYKIVLFSLNTRYAKGSELKIRLAGEVFLW